MLQFASASELGLNTHQSTGVGLDVARDARVKWVRVDLNWPDAQPSSAAPDFTLFDQIVDGAQQRGLSVLGVLAYTPAWASTGDTKGDGALNDIPDAQKWADYVSAAVQHFSGRVDHWEIWNEPNLTQFFEGTPQQYIDSILKPGADAVRAACAGCFVVGPALASVGGQYADWLDAVLAQASDKLDIVSAHDYAGFSADDPNVGQTSDSFFNKLDAHRLIQLGGTTIYEGPLSFREVMLAHNATQPFWMTETGLEAADAAGEDAQARYYQHVLDAMTTRPWWPVTIFYEAFDEPPAPYHWGVSVDVDGGYVAKKACDVLRGGFPDGGVADQGVADQGVADQGVADAGVPLDASVSDGAVVDARVVSDAAGSAHQAHGCDVGDGGFGCGPLVLLLLAMRRKLAAWISRTSSPVRRIAAAASASATSTIPRPER